MFLHNITIIKEYSWLFTIFQAQFITHNIYADVYETLFETCHFIFANYRVLNTII